MVLFAEASSDQLDVILDFLNIFCSYSGQSVSLQKSQIFVSKNVEQSLAAILSDKSGIPPTSDLGKCLGVPSIHGRVTRNMYKQVLDWVKSRLEGWKTKTLSFAVRKVLMKSVLDAIPLCSMQTTIPAGICSKIEKTTRNFLWGWSNEERKCHLIKWDTVTKPKQVGGLGIKKLHSMNFTLMAKLGWRLRKEKNSLWVQVPQDKCNRNSMELKPKKGSSIVWRESNLQWQDHILLAWLLAG